MKLVDALRTLEGEYFHDADGAVWEREVLLLAAPDMEVEDREFTAEHPFVYQVDEDGNILRPAVFSALSLDNALDLSLIQRSKGTWDPKIMEALAALAGLSEEWSQADGDTFEGIIDRIEEELDVDLYDI